MSTLIDTETPAPVAVGKVQRIFRYPVKSMTGEELTSCEINESGVVGDHLWALVEVATGKLANAKNPRKWGHLLRYSAAYIEEPHAGGEIPPIAITFPDGTVVRSDQPDVDELLSKSVGVEVHLSTMDQTEATVAEMTWIGEILGENNFSKLGSSNEHGELQIDFDLFGKPGRSYDLGDLHVMTTSALEHMKSLNPDATFDVRRYRPNFLIDTDESGLVETEWVGKNLHIGEASSTVVMNTVRCIMTTLPREELPLDRGTLRSLVKHNTRLVEPFGDWACIGVYSNITATGRVEIGSVTAVSDAVTDETGEVAPA
ncbi:MOSC N-terminal beta barrel domain-containing protein [Microbacterium testaceum]|nr:MOSC N-terminal beta barrel domain-containing protein [Microbacterium testaceum]